jgi:hypothetical protein
MQKDDYNGEMDTIHDILFNNGFPIHIHKPSIRRQATTPSDKKSDTTTHKWTSFTYIGKVTKFITNLFQKTSLKIALRTNNTVLKLLMPKHLTPDKCTRSGACKLTCLDCNKVYVGQTRRSFTERFNEQKHAFKTNSHTSNYAKHILEHSHSFGHIQNKMEIFSTTKKEPTLTQ